MNAVQTINRRALQDAERLDAALAASGPVGSLHCIPMLVKDQAETSDMPTTYGSAVFKDFMYQERVADAHSVAVGALGRQRR